MIINVDDDIKIDFTPKSVEDEIRQNIQMILAVNKNEQPLDRDFGINAEFIDSPTNIAKAKITAETIERVEKYEPRVKVIAVNFDDFDISVGKISPRLEVEVNV